MIYGYARVSTDEQKTDGQILELVRAGVNPDDITSENISGGVPARRRPGLGAILNQIKAGDTLIAAKLDRLGRDNIDVLTLLRELKEQGVRVQILNCGVDTSNLTGELVLHIMSAIASWERGIIKERCASGIAAYRQEHGGAWGKRKVLNTAARRDCVDAVERGESVRSIARRYGVSRDTVYRAIASAAA